eukprot:TRINITY_DN8832_c0_g1_i1.p1 TRINITY_DN8832_c0_g1~~TRINITY_DN8832_c0_g1_i1.p1  ORF type:complete len:225 (+),score=49.39 TRINITY_DN8832_c0_g1_i1:120-794(+)
MESTDTFTVFDAHSLRKMKIDGGKAVQQDLISLPDGQTVTAGQCSPLVAQVAAVAHEHSVTGFDFRQGKSCFQIPNAHGPGLVRCLDFNPNKLHFMVTGGDDCKVKFWDCRQPAYPVQVMSGHTHWVWNTKYNPHHDELVISSGSDGKVILWNLASISSIEVSDSTRLPDDGAIKVFEDHEESVYGLAWGPSLASSTWSFASLSYDGRIVINSVPQRYADLTKY